MSQILAADAADGVIGKRRPVPNSRFHHPDFESGLPRGRVGRAGDVETVAVNLTPREHHEMLQYFASKRGAQGLEDGDDDAGHGAEYGDENAVTVRSLGRPRGDNCADGTRGATVNPTAKLKPPAMPQSHKRTVHSLSRGKVAPTRSHAGNEEAEETESERVGDVNQLSGRMAYMPTDSTPRGNLRDYGWDANNVDAITDAMRAMQTHFQDMSKAVTTSTNAVKELSELLQKTLSLQQENANQMRCCHAPSLDGNPPMQGPSGGSLVTGSNDTQDTTHVAELQRSVAAIVEPAKLSARYVQVFQKCIMVGESTGDKGLSMWPKVEIVAKWSAATGAIGEHLQARLVFCLKFSAEHMAVWSTVSARMRGGITGISKTVLYRFLGIPRFVGGLPKEVQWKLVTCSVVRNPRAAYEEYLPDGFSMTWHCNEQGVPFSTWQFEIFIAAAYWRCLQRKNLRLHPYNVAFALYGAEYPVVHHDQYRTGLPTKDTPNIHNTNRMRAIVCNWMRYTILKWRTTRGGPRYIASEKAYQFSEGTHYNVLIHFPSPEEVVEMTEEIVGGEVYDGDDDMDAAAQVAVT